MIVFLWEYSYKKAEIGPTSRPTWQLSHFGRVDGFEAPLQKGGLGAWEKQVLSARGLKRVGRHSEYAI